MAQENPTPDELYLTARQGVDNDLGDQLLQQLDAMEPPQAPGSDLQPVESEPEGDSPEVPGWLVDGNISPPANIDDTMEGVIKTGEGSFEISEGPWKGLTYNTPEAWEKMGFFDKRKTELNTDFLRIKNRGFTGLALDMVSPLSVFGNMALAPGAEGATNIQEVVSSMGRAAVNSMQIKDGFNPLTNADLAGNFIDNQITEMQEGQGKDVARFFTTIFSDPALVMGTSAFKIAERGLRNNLLAGNAVGKNAWTQGIEEFLGKSQVSGIEATQLKAAAKKADEGDLSGAQQISDLFDESKDLAGKLREVEEKEVVDIIEDVVGTGTGERAKVVRKNDEKALTTNEYSTEINLDKLVSEEDIQPLFESLEKHYKKEFKRLVPKKNMNKIENEAQLNHLEDLIGTKVTHMEADEAYSLRQMLVSSAETAKRALNEYKNDPLKSDKAFLKVQKSLTLVKALTAKSRALKAHSGRLLNVHRNSISPSRDTVNQIKDMIGEMRQDPTLSDANLELLSQLDAEELVLSSKEFFKPKMADYFHEVFTNSILSGPGTHALNITSNSSNLLLRPTEKTLSSMSALSRGDLKEAGTDIREAGAMMSAIASTVTDLVKVAGRQTKFKDILPPPLIDGHEVAIQKYNPKITAENLGVTGPLANMVDYLGNGVRFFGNSLVTQDHVFKTFNYRMDLNAKAVRHADSIAKNTEEFTRLKADYLRAPNVESMNEAISTSEYYTFTNRLGETGTAIKTAIKRTPGGRWLLPFYQTPTNIVKFGVRHSVLGNTFIDLKHVHKATPEGDLARAKIAMGTMIPMALIATMGDNITGHIDQSTPNGRFKAQSGKKPYSIQIGEKSLSYEGIEPARSILGLMSGFKEAIDHLDPEEDEEIIKEATAAVIAPFLNITTDNWMLPVISETAQMIDLASRNNIDQATLKLKQIGASLAVPNLVSQVNKSQFDSVMRDSDTVMEVIKSRIPGLSKTVPAYRDLWGEERQMAEGLGPDLISPFKITDKPDVVESEIIRIMDSGIAQDVPGMKNFVKSTGLQQRISTVKLNNIQKSRFAEIRGKGDKRYGLPALKPALKELIESDEYKSGSDALKGKLLSYRIRKQNEAARKILLNEDPDLLNEIREVKAAQREALSK